MQESKEAALVATGAMRESAERDSSALRGEYEKLRRQMGEMVQSIPAVLEAKSRCEGLEGGRVVG